MTDALKSLPEAIESALAELMEAQFRLGMATWHLGPSAISRDAPQVLAASAAIVGVCNAVRAALAAPAVPQPQPVAWLYVPSDVWRETLITQDPERVALAKAMGREVTPLYAAAPTPQEPTRAEGE